MNLILAAWIAGIASLLFVSPNVSVQSYWPVLLLVVLLWIMGQMAQRYTQFSAHHQRFKSINVVVVKTFAVMLTALVGHVYAERALQTRLSLNTQEQTSISAVFYVAKIAEPTMWGMQQVAQRVDQPTATQHLLQFKPEQLTALPQGLTLGQYYAISGVLKPAHGYAMPNVFDVERWYLSQNWQGRLKVESFAPQTTAQVMQRVSARHIGSRSGYIHKAQLRIEQHRFNMRQQLLAIPIENRGLMLALLTGDRSLLTPTLEQQFQRFGISHLLAISGPHVLLLGLMCCWLLKQLINRFRAEWYLRTPRPILLIFPFLIAVMLYSAFVGFEIPALRTLITVMLLSVLVILNASIRPVRLILCSAAILLWMDPLSILSASFWLSYGACLLLLGVYQSIQRQQTIGSSRFERVSKHFQLLWQSQWKIFLVLLPLTLWIFGQVSWIAPISNMIAIPLLGLLAVPLNILAALMSFVAAPLAQLVWHAADLVLELLLTLLNFVDDVFSPQLSQWSWTPWQLVCVALAVFMLFMPRGSLPKFWVVFCLLPLFGWLQQPIAPQLHVLDVGQGQSILLRDAEQNILIDTGGYYDESRFSVGENVLLPYLRGQGVRQLNRVILSHLDQDHSGAFPALQQGMHIQAVQSNQEMDYPLLAPFSLCNAGQTITTEQFNLEILSPHDPEPEAVNANQNEYSCVVYVRFKHAQQYRDFLIMGDAGFAAETLIMQHYPNLNVDVLVLGHHGSKHSSSLQFLQHYKPKIAVASAGFANRYGHPSVEVLARLKQAKIPLLNTATSGVISFQINQIATVQQYRQQRLWLTNKPSTH